MRLGRGGTTPEPAPEDDTVGADDWVGDPEDNWIDRLENSIEPLQEHMRSVANATWVAVVLLALILWRLWR